ncbi:hypothetical protein Q427_12865 [Halomonas sp. BC04]|nr:hypothetical protein Q427_12865 [Halomonas sp. BC04]
MGGQPLPVSQLRCTPGIHRWQHLAPEGVLQRQQPGAGMVNVGSLDGRLHPLQWQAAVRVMLDGLGLDAA